jgi:hypothetical protein
MDDAARARYPSLQSRLAELDAAVVEPFVTHDHEALAVQRRHRQFQLALIVGAALTSALGALQAAVDAAWTGIAVAVVGAAATAVGNQQRRRAPLRQYLTARAKAEELRSLYFRYLAGLDGWDIRRLEAEVAAIVHPLPPAPETAPAPPPVVQSSAGAGPAKEDGTAATAEFLVAYDVHRLTDQYDWYGARVEEYDDAAAQTGFVNEGLLFLAAVCGAVGAAVASQTVWLGFAAALLAAVAAAVAAWADVVGFAANAELYRAARAGLAHLRPRRPDAAEATPAEVAAYVDDVEDILLGEVRTWSEKWGRAAESPQGTQG